MRNQIKQLIQSTKPFDALEAEQVKSCEVGLRKIIKIYGRS